VLFSDHCRGTWKTSPRPAPIYPCCRCIARLPDEPRRVCLFSSYTMRSGGMVLQNQGDNLDWNAFNSGLRADEDWPPDRRRRNENFIYTGISWLHINWPLGHGRAIAGEKIFFFFSPGGERRITKDSGACSTSAGIHARLDNYFQFVCKAKAVSGFDYFPEKPPMNRQKAALQVGSPCLYSRTGPGRFFPRASYRPEPEILLAEGESGPKCLEKNSFSGALRKFPSRS